MKLKKINKPHKIYAEVLESGAIDQFVKVMEHDAIVYGALMPDAHQGYSLPIGGVVASDGMIFPSYVGYDIGCGMCAINLGKLDIDPISRKEIFEGIYKVIPVGFNINKSEITDLSIENLTPEGKGIAIAKKYANARGSLGGGNHFIEIGVDEQQDTWIVIHSGSRGVGHGLATHYMKLAGGGKAKEGNHGFKVDSELGISYINDMNWALEFALKNRIEMINRVMDVLKVYTYKGEIINRNHNHATFKDGYWIHRKGATHAEKGMLGVIPGNMRDGSFIVKGKGNPDSLYSSSHGAGRVLGRKAAKETLNIQEFENTMKGVVAKVEQGTLDESPFAYKDIFEVMRLQEDLVEVLHHIKPIINIKG